MTTGAEARDAGACRLGSQPNRRPERSLSARSAKPLTWKEVGSCSSCAATGSGRAATSHSRPATRTLSCVPRWPGMPMGCAAAGLRPLAAGCRKAAGSGGRRRRCSSAAAAATADPGMPVGAAGAGWPWSSASSSAPRCSQGTSAALTAPSTADARGGDPAMAATASAVVAAPPPKARASACPAAAGYSTARSACSSAAGWVCALQTRLLLGCAAPGRVRSAARSWRSNAKGSCIEGAS